MTNGKDYIEIEEQQKEQIEEDYIKDLKEGKIDIPNGYILNWIDNFLQGNG